MQPFPPQPRRITAMTTREDLVPPPWQTNHWFEPIPRNCFGVFDGEHWTTAEEPQEFQKLLAKRNLFGLGPFVLPGGSGLLSVWDLPGFAASLWKALQEGVQKNLYSALNWTLILGAIVGWQYWTDPQQFQFSYLALALILFGLMPLAQAITERWQMRRKDFVKPGSLEDLRFGIWLAQQKTPVTYSLLAVLIVVYLATCWASSTGKVLALDPSGTVLLNWGMKVNELIREGQVWRLFTCIFLHANPVHVIFNSIALYQLGRVAEALLGSWRTVGVFLLTGLAGSVVSLLLSPYPSVGASGAVCGLLGVLAAFVWSGHAPSYLGRSVQSMIIGIMLLGFLASGYIDNAAHAGGLGAGLWLGWRYFSNRWSEAVPEKVES